MSDGAPYEVKVSRTVRSGGKGGKNPYLSLLIVLWNVQNQNPSELQKIIAEVNATHLDPQDILSDSLYYYNPQLKKIVIV